MQMKTNCFYLPISMLRMVCGDVTVFYPGVAAMDARLMLPRCRGPQGDQWWRSARSGPGSLLWLPSVF